MEHKAILIVEDDKTFARTLAQALKLGFEGEFEITVCASAEEAFEALTQQAYTLLVTDYRLPGEDGLSLISRAVQTYPGVESVLMTGDSSEEVLGAAREKASGYLGKPFDMLDLLLMVRQVLALPAPDGGCPEKGNSSCRILVLEDDAGLRRIYQKALEKANAYSVDQAATLEEARGLLDAGDYDILISDMRIGRDRATDLLKEYKTRFETSGIKVVMCSAFGQYRHLPDDVDHFLEKPISLDVLVSLVSELAKERRESRS